MNVKTLCGCIAIASLTSLSLTASASSHREAPFIATLPSVDGTDFYMFRSYESGRGDYVTLIANYLPLQDAYGGPNYFKLDDRAMYQIHIDNNGNANSNIRFRFRFATSRQDIALDIGDKSVPIPLQQAGAVGPGRDDTASLNVAETYQVEVVRGEPRSGPRQYLTDAVSGDRTFKKPVDNIGEKTLPDYAAYANAHIYDVNMPGCHAPARLFVGQRREGFVVNLGEIFDLVNTNPLGPVDGEENTLDDKNITSLALEISADCLTEGKSHIVGAWTSASLPQVRMLTPFPNKTLAGAQLTGGAFTQVSRLGNPLVNEVVIGLQDKDQFNASPPRADAQFADYVTNPTLPALLEVLFGVRAPTVPRDDLVAVFLTGVAGLNQPENVKASEMLRLNTAIAAVDAPDQNNLGVLGGDNAGFPNGRRPGDDVVDIALRAVMGVLLPEEAAPDGQLPYTDGAYVDSSFFDNAFPYLVTPLPGSPN